MKKGIKKSGLPSAALAVPLSLKRGEAAQIAHYSDSYVFFRPGRNYL